MNTSAQSPWPHAWSYHSGICATCRNCGAQEVDGQGAPRHCAALMLVEIERLRIDNEALAKTAAHALNERHSLRVKVLNLGGTPWESMKVTIVHNGIEKALSASANETVESLMVRAMITFNPPRSLVPVMGLFDKEGFQLQDRRSLSQSRVKDGDALLMRPTVIR